MTAQPASPPLRLTDAQVASFQRDGFLRVNALTDDAEVEVLLGLYDELFQRDGGFDAGDRIELNADVAHAPCRNRQPRTLAPRLIEGLAYRNAERSPDSCWARARADRPSRILGKKAPGL